MECCMFVINVVTIIIAIIAMYVAIHVARMTTKIQFLIDCYKECMEIGRLPNGSPSYVPRLNSLLDTIVVLGDEFKNFSNQYRIPGQTNLSLSNLDQLFLKYLKKYEKYIKV